jgi:hypothetical protein
MARNTKLRIRYVQGVGGRRFRLSPTTQKMHHLLLSARNDITDRTGCSNKTIHRLNGAA